MSAVTRFGFAKGHGDEWCVASPTDRTRMLCRRPLGHVPTPQPECPPPNLHEVCADVLARRGGVVAAPDDLGICPACWGDVPVWQGRVRPHGEWVVRDGGPVESERPCVGAGCPPEVG